MGVDENAPFTRATFDFREYLVPIPEPEIQQGDVVTLIDDDGVTKLLVEDVGICVEQDEDGEPVTCRSIRFRTV